MSRNVAATSLLTRRLLPAAFDCGEASAHIAEAMRFIAGKGSIAVDGVSLTVNEVGGGAFGVNIIPHTLSATTLGALGPGDAVNLEIDLLARYVARLNEEN